MFRAKADVAVLFREIIAVYFETDPEARVRFPALPEKK
jgi:hypothetical protein